MCFFITKRGIYIVREAGWDDPDALKVLVVKDTKSKVVFALAVPQKNIDDKRFAVGCIIEVVLWLGYAKVLVKSDNEPSMVKLLKESLATLKIEGFDASEEHPPPYDSQSNGAIEAAVKQVRSRMKMLKLCLERRIGKRIPPRHPIVAWLVAHCAAVIRF